MTCSPRPQWGLSSPLLVSPLPVWQRAGHWVWGSYGQAPTPCFSLVDSQGPHQLDGQQELHPLDQHNPDGVAAQSPDVTVQPPEEWGAAALQMHHPLGHVLVQAQGPEAALVIDRGSAFPGVDAAGGRKAAGLDPRRAAVKVPARVHSVSLEGRSPGLGPQCELSIYGCLVAKVVFSSFAIPWNVACQAPLSMGFSRQEYWSG